MGFLNFWRYKTWSRNLLTRTIFVFLLKVLFWLANNSGKSFCLKGRFSWKNENMYKNFKFLGTLGRRKEFFSEVLICMLERLFYFTKNIAEKKLQYNLQLPFFSPLCKNSIAVLRKEKVYFSLKSSKSRVCYQSLFMSDRWKFFKICKKF